MSMNDPFEGVPKKQRPETADGGELASLRAEARKQALADFKETERKALFAKMLEEELAKLGPQNPEELEDLVAITIDVPPNVFINQNNETGVSINGRGYVHGMTYQVPLGVANDLRHLMSRCWHNERSIGSPNREMNRRKVIDARAGQVIDQGVA